MNGSEAERWVIACDDVQERQRRNPGQVSYSSVQFIFL